MFDLRNMTVNGHVQVHFFFDLSDAGFLRSFMLFDFAAGKLPQSAQQTFGFSARDQHSAVFVNNAHRNMVQRCFRTADTLRKLFDTSCLVSAA